MDGSRVTARTALTLSRTPFSLMMVFMFINKTLISLGVLKINCIFGRLPIKKIDY